MKKPKLWADVAHHYLLSNIEMRDVGKWKHPTEYFTPSIPRTPQLEDLTLLDRGDIQLKPVLRHLDDMSEVEDNECMLIHTQWVHHESVGPIIWSLAKQHKSFDQYSAHWLISHGFDVFGLIESGQAIRKGDNV